MKPPMDELRVRYAIDLLAKELDASKQEIRQALTNEARAYRKEEPESDIRIGDLK